MPPEEASPGDFLRIFNTVEVELIDHIRKITEHPFIVNNFKSIVSYLSEDDDCILKEYSNLKKELNSLANDLKNRSLQSRCFDLISTFAIDFLSKESKLQSYFNDLVIIEPIRYFSIQYDKRADDLNSKHNIFFEFDFDIQNPVFVHKDFYSRIIKEVFSNCITHNTEKKFITCKVYQEEYASNWRLCIDQNSPSNDKREIRSDKDSFKHISSTKLFKESMLLFGGTYNSTDVEGHFIQYFQFTNFLNLDNDKG